MCVRVCVYVYISYTGISGHQQLSDFAIRVFCQINEDLFASICYLNDVC